MIVEDDPLSQFMMRELCEELGYQFDIADNGETCLAHLQKQPDRYDIIMMDIHMPGMSGDTVVREIRQRPDDPPKSMPVFAVTADTVWHSQSHCRNSGFDGFLAKPIDVEVFRDTVRSHALR
nr:response regulator [Pseudaestuariivita rosea]